MSHIIYLSKFKTLRSEGRGACVGGEGEGGSRMVECGVIMAQRANGKKYMKSNCNLATLLLVTCQMWTSIILLFSRGTHKAVTPG